MKIYKPMLVVLFAVALSLNLLAKPGGGGGGSGQSTNATTTTDILSWAPWAESLLATSQVQSGSAPLGDGSSQGLQMEILQTEQALSGWLDPCELLGACLNFSGSNYALVTNGATVFFPTNALTVEFWFATTNDPTSQQWPVGAYTGSQNGWTAQFYDVGQGVKPAFIIETGQGQKYVEGRPVTILDGQWHHYAGVWKGASSNLYVFIDGRLLASNTTPRLSYGTAALRIGAISIGGYFRGKIDEVRISDSARYTNDFIPVRSFSTSGDTNTIAYYKLDEGQGKAITNIVGNGHNGTLTSSNLWTDGIAANLPLVTGSGLEFGGVTNHVVAPYSAAFYPTNALTVEFWYASTWNPTVQEWPVGAYPNSSGYGWEVQFYNRGGGLWPCFIIETTNGQRYVESTNAVAGALDGGWHHYAGVWNGSTLYVFLDGSLLNTGTASNLRAPASGGLWLGAVQKGGNGSGWFHGKIDEVRISKVARYTSAFTPSHSFSLVGDTNTIAYYKLDENNGTNVLDETWQHDAVLYGLPPSPWIDGLPDGLAAWWKLDETNGVIAADASGYGNNATLQTGATWASGVLSNGVSFDGSGGYATVTNTTCLDGPVKSVTCWVKFNGFGDNAILNNASGTNSTGDGFFIASRSDGTILFQAYDGSGNAKTIISTTSLSTQTWHLLTLVLDGSNLAGCVNGAVEGMTNCVDYTSSTATFFQMAKQSGLGYGNLVLDDVRIYNRVLGPEEIRNLYNTDTDGDGMPDWWESTYGLNPMVNDASGDLDGDELTNLQEYQHGTKPNNADTDGDGMPDGWEVRYGLNPTSGGDAHTDLDGDGIDNLTEYLQGLDPTRWSISDSDAQVQLTVYTPME